MFTLRNQIEGNVDARPEVSIEEVLLDWIVADPAENGKDGANEGATGVQHAIGGARDGAASTPAACALPLKVLIRIRLATTSGTCIQAAGSIFMTAKGGRGLLGGLFSGSSAISGGRTEDQLTVVVVVVDGHGRFMVGAG